MKKFIIPIIAFLTLLMISSFALNNSLCSNTKLKSTVQKQTINMFVTHGHCSTPFAGKVNNLRLDLVPRNDLGNPLENMKLSFDVDPNSFNVCRGEELTQMIKTPGLFISEKNEKITFRTTEVYTMGLDWYQINGKLSIKGIERSVKFFATGIRNPKESNSTLLIIEGQVNLLDWDIDYDLIVNGESNNITTKMMHLNMKIKI